jgi:hypothetical protein
MAKLGAEHPQPAVTQERDSVAGADATVRNDATKLGLIAQEDPCLTRTIPITPIDAQGNPLRGLRASNLLGKVHGRPVEILSVTLNTQPRRIMVCVDLSGSMTSSPGGLWPVTRIMLEDIAEAGPTVGQIGMELFAEDVFYAVNISPNPGAVRMKVASLLGAETEGLVAKRTPGTALWDALWQAVDQFTPPSPEDVIYVLTDGSDNRSYHTDKQLEEKLLSHGIRVFAFIPAVPLTLRAHTPEESEPKVLQGIVTATGGNFIYLCPDPRDSQCKGLPGYSGDGTRGKQRSALLDAAHRLYQQMAVHYDVTIRLPFALEKSAKWDLVIADDRGHKRRDIELLYPRGLSPCEKWSFAGPSTPK